MKKMFLFTIIAAATFSCAKKVSQENTTVKETQKEVLVGGDSDSHGCKGSAGYSWSTLKKECIRIFEGTKLSHTEETGKTYTTASYVIFDGNKAELFLGTQKESIILERKSEGEAWKKDDLELIPWKGYVLKKAGKIIYTGE